MFSTNYKPIPFHRWLEENREDIEAFFTQQYGGVETEKCDECNGLGYVVCDRDCEHDCEECDGSGDITKDRLIESFANESYNEQVKKDQKKVKEYLASCLS